MFIGLRLM